MSHKERIEFSSHTFSGDGYASAGNLLYAADGLDMPGIAITDRNSLIYIDDVLFESRLRGMVDRHNPFKVIFGFSVKIVDDLMGSYEGVAFSHSRQEKNVPIMGVVFNVVPDVIDEDVASPLASNISVTWISHSR